MSKCHEMIHFEFNLLVISLEEFCVYELHNLIEKRVAGDEADVEGQCIVMLFD